MSKREGHTQRMVGDRRRFVGIGALIQLAVVVVRAIPIMPLFRRIRIRVVIWVMVRVLVVVVLVISRGGCMGERLWLGKIPIVVVVVEGG